MLHRAIDDYWHIVAGVVEDGETFAEAAARELREETGLEAVVSDLRIHQTYQVPEVMRAEYLAGVEKVEIENFVARVPVGWEPLLNEEHDLYRWLSPTESIALEHWPETKEVIAAIAASSV
jgi:8-oxo-dGTP pyrophosphatase MutT (NUDIX family)